MHTFSGDTIVVHDLAENTTISPCEHGNCFRAQLNYTGAIAQIHNLINQSPFCYQEIKVKLIQNNFS